MNSKNKIDIKSKSMDELKELVEAVGEKPFRAAQLYEWLHQKQVEAFDQMSNIPAQLRAFLAEECQILNLQTAAIQSSQHDGTRKYLFALPDQNIIESVWMKYKHGNTVCISSQAGCRMGCRFCASTLDGLVRSLTPAEMLEQVYNIQRETGARVSNVVVMGTGEPLDNYDHLLTFLKILSSEKGQNLSQRNITVSTCGLVPEIRALADEKLQITLALSLHAASQEKRQHLMPVARKYELDEVIKACKYYFKQTGRRITFEYSLIENENDTKEDADKLWRLIKGMNCHVNLIPVNPIKEREYKQSSHSSMDAFKNMLEKNGINVTIRREMGRDIDGACGQLRKRFLER